jgi:heterodisulfide reductase subunit A
VEVVDLRSLAFSGDGNGAGANKSAEISIATGLEKLKGRNPLATNAVPVEKKALVLGGGIAGMTAALTISQAGYPVTLLEQGEKLGGQLQRIFHTVDGNDPRKLMANSVKRVEEDPRIEVLTEVKVVQSFGSLGRFHTVIEDKDGNERVEDHGIAIVATGANEAKVQEYCYGESETIMTQEEFEENLAQYQIPQERLNTVVMIQCVGSRNDNRPYCSRICCSAALKNAFKVLERNKAAKIYILCRDLMSYGFLEEYYTRARSEGVRFIPYTLEKKPEVALENGTPTVTFEDPILKKTIRIKTDSLVLSTGMVPSENGTVAELFSLERNEDGFFREADAKWRPVDFIREGVFVCGTAHSPRTISESITQAQCAAERALAVLSKEALVSARVVAEVKTSLCTLCETCLSVCPFEARFLDEIDNRIVVDQAACQACGACSVACPSGAAFVQGLEDKQTMAVIEATLEDAFNNI